MATRALDFAERGVSVGRVLQRGFSTIWRHPLPALAVAVFFTGLPGTAGDYLLQHLVPWQYMTMTVGSLHLPGDLALLIALWFVSLLFGAVAQGAMTRPAIATEEGCKASLGETVGAALRVLIPLIILGIIMGIGVVIGTSLLIVPGIIVYLLWAVAASAEADEREGVFLALSRSQELSEGARWKVFLLMLVLMGISIVAAILTAFILFVLLTFGWSVSNLPLINLALRGFVGAIVNVIWGAVQASLYVELKEWKEGGSVENLEQVFA